MNLINNFLFSFFPYLAVFIFIFGSVYRYLNIQHSYSSLSSQFLEKKMLFFSSIPFHFGILVMILFHLCAFIFPDFVINFLRTPEKLIFFETLGLIFGISVFFGIFFFLIRRFNNKRLQMVTTKLDVVIELVLLIQIFLGCLIAIEFRWGSIWFASSLSPYLWSLINFNPSLDIILNMNFFIKSHVFLAFFILFLFPFGRLVHFFVAPFHYIFRSNQIVRWNIDKKKAKEFWTIHRPNNN